MLIIGINYENQCSFSVNVAVNASAYNDKNTAMHFALRVLEDERNMDSCDVDEILIVECDNVLHRITYENGLGEAFEGGDDDSDD